MREILCGGDFDAIQAQGIATEVAPTRRARRALVRTLQERTLCAMLYAPQEHRAQGALLQVLRIW